MKHPHISKKNTLYYTLFFFSLFILLGGFVVHAATNISSSSSDHWAWNDVTGWIDFYTTNTVEVTSQKIRGYAESSIGDISLDCATTRLGDICSQSTYGVENDGSGNLSGWAWNDTYGWVSFYCGNTGGCGQSNYRVYIDSNGDFHDYAWNDVVGWISFNCANYGGCGASNYKVLTSWTATSTVGILDSSTYDTGISGGAQIQSVWWKGSLPVGTAVRFQFATSDSSTGPWDYQGSDGTSGTYYSTDPDVSLPLQYVLHGDNRYFRYRITLESNQAQTATPQVDEVIVNWSP